MLCDVCTDFLTNFLSLSGYKYNIPMSIIYKDDHSNLNVTNA